MLVAKAKPTEAPKTAKKAVSGPVKTKLGRKVLPSSDPFVKSLTKKVSEFFGWNGSS